MFLDMEKKQGASDFRTKIVSQQEENLFQVKKVQFPSFVASASRKNLKYVSFDNAWLIRNIAYL